MLDDEGRQGPLLWVDVVSREGLSRSKPDEPMAPAALAGTPRWHVWESDMGLCPPVERMREMTPAHTSCLGASLASAGRWENPWRIFKGGAGRHATADRSRAQQEAQAEQDGRQESAVCLPRLEGGQRRSV